MIGCTSSAIIASFISRPPIFLPKILRRSSDHLAGDEYSDDDEQKHVDHADAFAAEEAIQPHPRVGRKTGDRVETVVLAIHSAVGDVNRQCRKRSACRCSEAHLFPFEISQVLIDRQSGDRRQGHDLLASRSVRVWNLVSPGDRMRCQSRIWL